MQVFSTCDLNANPHLQEPSWSYDSFATTYAFSAYHH